MAILAFTELEKRQNEVADLATLGNWVWIFEHQLLHWDVLSNLERANEELGNLDSFRGEIMKKTMGILNYLWGAVFNWMLGRFFLSNAKRLQHFHFKRGCLPTHCLASHVPVIQFMPPLPYLTLLKVIKFPSIHC